MRNYDNLYPLSFRSNLNIYNYYGKAIVVYDDHRYILNVLFEAAKQNLFNGETPNIIYFDHHDDGCATKLKLKDILEKYRINEIKEMNSRDFWTMIEFDLSSSDDDWVTSGMELGLIKDVVCIGSKENHNISNWEKHTYKATNGDLHKGYCIGHLKHEIGNRGSLGDSMTSYHPDYLSIRNVFGYKDKRFYDNVSKPFVLDFDLDCFTTECRDITYAWPERIFQDEYSPNNEYEVFAFLKELFTKASFITICREPKCCGGIGESNKILSYLDKYFFDGVLKTEPLM